MGKRVLAVVLAVCLLLGAVYVREAPRAEASGWNYETWPNKAKMKNGVGSYGSWRRSYWIDQSAMQYEDYIVQARNDWVYTSNVVRTSIDIQRTYTKKDAVFEIHQSQRYRPAAGNYAETDFYEFASSANIMDGGADPSRDYYWTYINLNGSNFASLRTNVGGLNHQKGTIAHEFGHAFGLAHLPDSNSYKVNYLMCKTGDGRNVDCVQRDELMGINDLYG